MIINKAISEYVFGFLKINYSNYSSEQIFFADKILTAMDAGGNAMNGLYLNRNARF
jgi:hypothetical protein